MFLAILTLITALSISAVAIYYSVAGLVAIFAAAAIPIIIMGGVLEIGKLVTAVWLHKHWHRATWWLKTYLSTAVIVLMFITSMGIFGFLSKAHIEQTSAAGEGVAQIEQIEKEIARQQAVIARAEQIIETTQTSGTGADQNIQSQIDREQQRIDTAYDRVQPAIDATRAQLESDKKFYLDQLPGIDEKLAQFETLSRIDTNDEEQVKRLQALVGARPDGAYGGGTARAVKAYKEGLEAERTDILAKVEELKANSAEEIARLRSRAESEIDDSNKLITRLRSQLGTSTGEDIDAIIDEQNARIKSANIELDTLTEEKFTLEAEYRKLEAEVGPIKYIAEFIYGEQADKNLLEEAVRWVIIVIILVFDPLAVLLLIASQYTFNWYRSENETTTEKEDESNSDDDGPEDPDRDGPTNGTDTGSEEPIPEEQAINLEQVEKVQINTTPEQEEALQLLAEQTQEWPEKLNFDHELQGLTEDLNREKIDEAVEGSKTQTKEIETTLDSEFNQEEQYDETDEEILESVHEAEREAMRLWKADNPDDSLKRQRLLLKTGKIDLLPWETDEYLELDDDATEALRWIAEQQDLKKKIEVDRETRPDSNQKRKIDYVQNSEQSTESIWNQIKNKK